MMSLWTAQRIQPQRQLLVWTSLGLLTAFIVQQIRQWYRLRHIPGPRLAGWSILWQLSGALSGRYHEILNEVAEEYGLSRLKALADGTIFSANMVHRAPGSDWAE
jgi:hypothetical protein